jgi:hypothetical protein
MTYITLQGVAGCAVASQRYYLARSEQPGRAGSERVASQARRRVAVVRRQPEIALAEASKQTLA